MISAARTLVYGDVIYIFGLKIIFMGFFIAINRPEEKVLTSNLRPYTPELYSSALGEDEYFTRSPREIQSIYTDPIEIEPPPALQSTNKQPLIFTIGPAFTMVIPMVAGVMFTLWGSRQSDTMTSSPFVFMGIITSLTAAVIGVFWALMNYRYNSKTEKNAEKKRVTLYNDYLRRVESKIKETNKHNFYSIEKAYPSPEDTIKWSEEKSVRLWERDIFHGDFLSVRLGIGTQKTPTEIIIPKDRFSLIDDSLLKKPYEFQQAYKQLENLPTVISLMENKCIGVVSKKSNSLINIMRTILLSLSATHSYMDVKFVCLFDDDGYQDAEYIKWLPHIWDSGRRLIARDETSAKEILHPILEVLRRREEKEEREDDNHPLPHYVFFVQNMELMHNTTILKYLLKPKDTMGISTLLFAAGIDRLPNSCTTIIRDDAEYSGFYSVNNSFHKVKEMVFDITQKESLVKFSRALAPIKVRKFTVEGEIPNHLSFLGMYGTSKVEDLDINRRWLENRSYESMKALIGHGHNGEPVYLDVHEKQHGPHGLVAGTTGSGKSETLQTYILSLAINYHPTELTFILIDYKGGGMAAKFEGLPHLAGIITNLSGNQTYRALISINSEIKRRQAVFSKHKINHIDTYIEMYRRGIVDSPIPHLLIIADEFAELKNEQEDFVRELVSASRVGRSLGIHLILATQKPSGVVDDEIWGNSKFRLCLRVQDKQDSMEMLHKAEAAYITNVGRGFFQVGNDEIFEEFQSAWSGADYLPNSDDIGALGEETSMINFWGKPIVLETQHITSKSFSGESQLEAVTNHIIKTAQEHSVLAAKKIWVDSLSTKIYYSELMRPSEKKKNLNVLLGLVDDPRNQEQYPLVLDLYETGHIFVSGSANSGKTTFLQTLLYSLVTSHTSEDVNIYIADFGSRALGVFESLPHVGGVAFDNDPHNVSRTILLLLEIFEKRRHLFSEKGVASYTEYLEHYSDLPLILFVIDNFAIFSEQYSEYEDNIVFLLREAASYGILLIITATGDVRGRVKQNLSTCIGLQLPDKFEYDNILGERVELMPEDNIPGRGLIKLREPLEFQVAFPIRLEEGEILSMALGAELQKIAKNWNGAKAPGIPAIPEDLSLDAFFEYTEITDLIEKGMIPVGYDLVSGLPVGIIPEEYYCYTISGLKGTGKHDVSKLISRSLLGLGSLVVIGSSTENSEYYKNKNIINVTSAYELYEYLENVLVPEFSERNKKLHENEDLDSSSNIYVFIQNMQEFCQWIYDAEKNMNDFLELALSKGQGHKIWWHGIVPTEGYGELKKYEFVSKFTNYETGIHLGGQADKQNIFNFDLSYNEQSKRYPAGEGLINIGKKTIRTITARG